MRVKYYEVGRAKKSWTTDLPLEGSLTADEILIAKEAKKALVSQNVEAVFDDATLQSGVILAGLRKVGHFKVVTA